MKLKSNIVFALITLLLFGTLAAQTVVIEGTKQRWHKITLKLTGPSSSELNSNNPFLNYRFNVTFTHPATGTTYIVPGYFAADGNAANSNASSGNKWKAHLSPDHTGTWNYSISFRQGTNVAVNSSATAGSALAPFNGLNGSFNVSESDKTGRDFRSKNNGRLKYVGQRYLQFSGSGKYFLKQGPDAPENFLNYADFDGMFNNSRLKTWSAHVSDWKSGDPTWDGGKGKGIIGSLNYLASEGMNVFSFLTMNIGGDDNNAYPYVVDNNATGNHPDTSKIVYLNTRKTVMDCSKLEQWEIVFEHADKLGLYLHFKTQETENDQYLDGGNLGTERKLYYRELIARFGHHLALNWNLGEENTNSSSQIIDFCQYFYDNDPYRHNVVLHTYPGEKSKRYDPLLGSKSKLTGLSLQTSKADFSQVHGDVLEWVAKSESAGKPWVVAVDEPGDAGHAIRPDYDAGNSHEDGRKFALWGTLLAGGAGDEWYFGYQHDHSDLTCQDFRSRNKWWDYCRYALNFFNNYNVPFTSMDNRNDLIGNGSNSNSSGYCFAKTGSDYVIYLPSGGSKNLNLNGVSGTFQVKWYDPRNGGGLQNGSVTSINGGGSRSIGNAPNNTGKDWVVYVSGAVIPQLPTVHSINLVDANANSIIKALSTGDIINTNDTPSFTLDATASNAGSVRFEVDANTNYQTESYAPYSITGDTSGNYNPWTIANGTYTVRATAYAGSGATGQQGNTVSITIEISDADLPDLPPGQIKSDVGNVGSQTLAAYDNGTYLISASGADIWGKADSFGFVNQDASGDLEVTAKIDSIQNTNAWAKAGVMIRENLDADSKHAMTVITPANGVSFQRRTATGVNSGHTTIKGITAPEYVRVLRLGDNFTGYYSADSQVWYPMNTVNISMSTDVKAGLAVTSHNNSAETEAMISNFSVRTPSASLAVTRFILVNADTDQDIREIFQNETINLAVDGANLSIRAETSGVEESVVFYVDGTKFQTESAAVYALAGNSGSDYKPWTPSTGVHTIMATPFSENGGAGNAGSSLAVVINVVNNP